MAVSCPACKRPLDLPDPVGEVHCVCSKRPMGYRRFPAYDRPPDLVMAASAELEADATCLHHPEKKAEAVCEDCGIFMCGLCATEDKGDALCLTCYGARQMKGLKTKDTQNAARTTQYDNIALAASLFSVFVWYMTFLTAPAILFVVVRQWKHHPYSVVPRSRLRLWLAAAVSVLQLGGWIVFIGLLAAEGL